MRVSISRTSPAGAMQKYKVWKTVDCVVGGYLRPGTTNTIEYLLLGLYDDAGLSRSAASLRYTSCPIRRSPPATLCLRAEVRNEFSCEGNLDRISGLCHHSMGPPGVRTWCPTNRARLTRARQWSRSLNAAPSPAAPVRKMCPASVRNSPQASSE